MIILVIVGFVFAADALYRAWVDHKAVKSKQS